MVLITGGAGDVGRELVSELASKTEEDDDNISIVAFDVATNPLLASFGQKGNKKIKFVRGNILNLSEVLSSINQSKVVIHLASMLTSDCEVRPFEAVSVNMLGTATVMEACRLAGCVKRFIFTSTSSVYGATGGMGSIDENFPKEPMNIYGALKYGSELYCRNYAKKYGIEYAALRLRVIFGPGQRNDTGAMKILGVKNLLESLLTSREGTFVGAPDEKLEVTHPKDAAHALALASTIDELKSNAYNIMTGSYSFGEIARAFENAVPGSHIRFNQTKANDKPLSGGPGTNFGIYDISKSQKELGYKPSYTLEKIVSEVVEHQKNIVSH